MAGIINTGSFAKSLMPGVKAWFGASYNEYVKEYTKIFKQETSDKAYEEMVSVTSMGLAGVKSEGSSIAYDAMKQFYVNRTPHVVYGLGFIITREHKEDNQYTEVAKARSTALGFSMRQTKEIVGANLINRAFTAGYTFGDGQVLCSASHPIVGGTFSNIPSVAGDLSGAVLEQGAIDIAAFVNNRGLKIKVMPQSLLIHPSNMFEAERILKSALEYDTANNAVNALKSLGSFPKGVNVNHYLTDADAWFILTDCPNGLTLFQRRALELSSPENDFDTENAKFKATERYSFTNGDPRSIYGSAGA